MREGGGGGGGGGWMEMHLYPSTPLVQCFLNFELVVN